MSTDMSTVMSSTATLQFGYTPDPDDAFHYYAFEHGRVVLPSGGGPSGGGPSGGDPAERPRFVRRHIQDLNEMALNGDLEVTAISSIFYPKIAERYAILAAGASVGRGYGPVLAAHDAAALADLDGQRVAVPGLYTTGCFLLRFFYGGFEPVPMPFDEVPGAIIRGEVAAGVLIHEELCHRDELRASTCLGRRWLEETGLPLPVGLVVGRRDLGHDTLERIDHALAASMEYALAHREEAVAFARGFGRGEGSRFRDEYIDKFANRDTVSMPQDVRDGLAELFRRAHEAGLIEARPECEIVGGVA